MLPRSEVSKSHLHCVCTSAVASTLHSMFSSQVVSSLSCFLIINCLSSSHHLLICFSVKLGHFLFYAKIFNGTSMLITSQSYLLVFFFRTLSFHLHTCNEKIFFKGPNSNISTFILLFSFHWGEERAFLSLGASLGPQVYFTFSLQFDTNVLSHRIHTYRNNSVQYWSNCNWMDPVIKHGSTCW